MNDHEKLVANTAQFFTLHWGVCSDIPQWDFSWQWCNAVPNYQLGGVYALFSGDTLQYVGLGSSVGGGIYKDHGISRRLLAHVLKSAPADASVSYEAQDRWKALQVDLVATIGFPTEYSYLASALEDYLIGRLSPPENRLKRQFAPAVAGN
ncbi:MAG: hypothetical protein H6Q76_2651 [Firmicutes bacterium]|nr:hypothetical protein [Bacillota bacterium]